MLSSVIVCIDMRENLRWSWENFHFGDLANYPKFHAGGLIRASFPLYVWAHGPGRGLESAFLLQTDLNAVLNGRRLQLCDTSSCKEVRPPLGNRLLCN